MGNLKKFTFLPYEENFKKGEIFFHFRIDLGEESFSFTEKVTLPGTDADVPLSLIKSVLDSLSLVIGINYWKLYCPSDIDLGEIDLTVEQAQFWNKVYTNGLGEFYFKNKIDFRNLVNFPHKNIDNSATNFPRKNRILLPIGGGKDSIVSAEILKDEGKDFDVFIVGNYEILLKVAEIMDKKPIIIKRELDSKLFELNKQEDTYNGHVPVSAAYAFLGVLASVLFDYSSVVVSNEKSSNYGNVRYLGQEINHQWSKSEEFENMFNKYLNDYITPDIKYYSFLRKYSELEIGRMFSNYPQYFKQFSSCNTNFKINGPKSSSKWCGKCPKCLFVFTILSAFISKEKLVEILGKNLFEDESILPYFKELLGIGIKPFECVGTPEEMKEALDLALKNGEFSDTHLMKYYKENK